MSKLCKLHTILQSRKRATLMLAEDSQLRRYGIELTLRKLNCNAWRVDGTNNRVWRRMGITITWQTWLCRTRWTVVCTCKRNQDTRHSLAENSATVTSDMGNAEYINTTMAGCWHREEERRGRGRDSTYKSLLMIFHWRSREIRPVWNEISNEPVNRCHNTQRWQLAAPAITTNGDVYSSRRLYAST